MRPKEGSYKVGNTELEVHYNGSVTVFEVAGVQFMFNSEGQPLQTSQEAEKPESELDTQDLGEEQEDPEKRLRIKVPRPPMWPR